MPLGQAPYGSRQEPPGQEPPEDPRQRGDRLVARGRWIFFMGTAVLLAFVAARGAGRGADRSAHGPQGPNPCLTDKSCAAGWRCYAIPKDDPFVVEGQCAQACEDSLQCPSHFQCEKVAVAKGQVVPLGARGATAEQLGVCRQCGPDGCRPE